MKYVNVIMFLIISLCSTNAFASDSSQDKPLPLKTQELSNKCNIEAKNALVNGDLELVEALCLEAIKELEKTQKDRELLINPIMNLAFSYTLAGQFDKATPLYNKARKVSAQLYGPDSKELKEIDALIKNQEEIKKQKPKQ